MKKGWILSKKEEKCAKFVCTYSHPPYLSNTLTNLCIALYCIPLYCVVVNCTVLLIYCFVDIIQYNTKHKFVGVLDNPLGPGSYVAFLPCRMQFKQKIMRQIISLSIVSNGFDTAEMRRMNRALFPFQN